MSDEKEVAQKLEEALRRYGADYGFVVTDKSVRKLIDGSAYATVEVKDCTPKKLAEAFMEVGKVIEQSDDGMECVGSSWCWCGQHEHRVGCDKNGQRQGRVCGYCK